jgi:hypothetical protein
MECCSLCRFRFAPVEPIKKPQPETRRKALPQSSGVAVRPVIGPVAPSHLTAPFGFSISRFVPDRWRGNIRLESMQSWKLHRNMAVRIAANFYITADKVRSYCAVQ